jgi:2-desacetyl-2-hydroxyethyl bacteriochlorophyllide A dehydrogenase
MNASIYRLTGPGQLHMEQMELAADSLPDDEIVAATVFSVISPGTELAAWLGKPPLRPGAVYPRLMGYCNTAIVTHVGAGVHDVRVGDAILTHQSHRSHFRCAAKEVLLVLSGGTAEMQQRMATTYLYHLGYMALIDGGYVPGHDVAIIGFGALGFAAASLVRAFGGDPVVFTSRPAIASQLLPGITVRPKAATNDAFPSRALLDGADIVIETSDAWDDYLLALRSARKGGTVVLLGFPGRGQNPPGFNPLDSQFIYDKSLTIRQVGHVVERALSPTEVRFTLPRNLRYLFSLIERGAVDPSPFLAARFDWTDLAGAYASLASREGAFLSAVLDWRC